MNHKQVIRKILIIDKQKWIEDLFYEALHRDDYLVVVVQDAVEVNAFLSFENTLER